MPPLVNAIGTIRYNGYTFGPFTRCEIEGRSVLSQDGRTISHIIYQITVRTTIALNEQTTDDMMTSIRRLLQSQGGALEISNTGFGSLSVNSAGGGPKDVLWGPIPEILRWKPVGSSRACEVTWSCQVAIPECPGAVTQFALMEVNTKYSWDNDNSGYTTRVFSGFLRIPQTRASQASRSLSDNADAYRARIIPPPMLGFKRKEKFDIDDSKCRLDFSITDEMMPPNAPPAGIVNARADHTIQSPTPLANKYSGTISATYEVSRDQPRVLAWLKFLELINDRIGAAAQFGVVQDGNRVKPMLFNLVMREPEIYGRESAAFSINYTFYSSIGNLLQASGLWRVPPGSDYAVWAASMANGQFAADGRGFAGLGFTNNQDAIIDLCQQPAVALASAARQVQSNGQALTALVNPYPDASNSWLDYQSMVQVQQKDYTVALKPLPSAQPTLQSLTNIQLTTVNSLSNNPSGGAAALNSVNPTGGFSSPYNSGTPTAGAQSRAVPDFHVVLEGNAIRAGYLITPPALTSFAGSPVMPVNEDEPTFQQSFVTSFFGVPIFAAKWKFKYLLATAPQDGFGVPPSPFMGQ